MSVDLGFYCFYVEIIWKLNIVSSWNPEVAIVKLLNMLNNKKKMFLILGNSFMKEVQSGKG